MISEDEDEFVFDNLSHKSSGSSLNIQRIGLQPPPVGTPNFTPRHPSPLLNNGVSGVGSGSAKGKQAVLPATLDEDASIDAEMEQLELDFSVRAHARANANASASGNASTLPPPSKPPRIPLSQVDEQPAAGSLEREKPKEKPAEVESDKDEWASKLYGGGKYLEIGSSCFYCFC